MAGFTKDRPTGWDQQGIRRSAGTTKLSGGRVYLRLELASETAKASTAPGSTTGLIFCSDEMVWSVELGSDGITGLGAAA